MAGRTEVATQLSGGDAADQVFLLGFGFGADGEGIQQIQRKREVQRFVLAVAHLALAERHVLEGERRIAGMVLLMNRLLMLGDTATAEKLQPVLETREWLKRDTGRDKNAVRGLTDNF